MEYLADLIFFVFAVSKFDFFRINDPEPSPSVIEDK